MKTKFEVEEISKEITGKIIIKSLEMLEKLEDEYDEKVAWWDIKFEKDKTYLYGEFNEGLPFEVKLEFN